MNTETEEKNLPSIEVPEDDYQESDVFLWANNLVPIKEELTIELFLFNKNYTLYKTRYSKDLLKQMQPLFLDNLLEFVLSGAGEGLFVRSFEDGEGEKNVLQRIRYNKVENARTLMNWLKTQEHEIETFVEEEHDFKRIKGILLRCSHKDIEKPFYIIKRLPQAQIMTGKTGWMMREGRFVHFDADAALRIPDDNQLLILDQDMYVFNQMRLDQIFSFDAKKNAVAEKKVKAIEDKFNFNFAEGLSIQELVKGKKNLVNKLQKLEIGEMKQEDLLDHAEEMGVNLMTDDTGAVIIMDAKDLTKFINLLNDDYIESALTGNRYEVRNKRPLKPEETEDDLLKQALLAKD